MPKIIVREKDQTSAGTREYSNFAVLIPGFVQNTDKFDELATKQGSSDSVCTFTKAEDFIEYVGKIGSGKVEATFAEVEKYDLDRRDYYTYGYAENYKVYLLEESWTELQAGKNKAKRVMQDASIKYYNLTPVDVDTTDFDENKDYAVCEVGNEGHDADADVKHYGNQMAYELLKLGYTILYKKLNSIEELESEPFWKPLKDKALYTFRYVVTGLLEDNDAANKAVAELVSFRKDQDKFEDIDIFEAGRGDCFALCDINEKIYDDENAKTQYEIVNKIKEKAKLLSGDFAGEYGKYIALITPSITYEGLDSKDYDNNNTLPGSFHYLACAAKAFRNYSEWYAVAGYNRGICDLLVKGAKVNLGEYAINALQPRVRENACCAVNVITNIRGNYYLWGNRTAFYDATRSTVGLVASDFLNIRQLCTTIKQHVYGVCRQFTFDPNSDILWVNFANAISPLLERMKADQGIKEYKIVKIATEQKGLLKARIRIIPIEAVEDFDIMLSLEDSISGTVVSFND